MKEGVKAIDKLNLVRQLGQIDPRRIIHLSVLIIISLGVIAQITKENIFSILTVFFIVIVALSNIGYFYSKVKKRNRQYSIS